MIEQTTAVNTRTSCYIRDTSSSLGFVGRCRYWDLALIIDSVCSSRDTRHMIMVINRLDYVIPRKLLSVNSKEPRSLLKNHRVPGRYLRSCRM